MPQKKLKSFPAVLKSLPFMLEKVSSFAAEQGFLAHELSKIELAVEEALVNIIQYAYPSSFGFIELACQVADKQKGIKVIISDQGIPHNPLMHENSYNPDRVLKSKGVGGYGIFFILKIMDKVEYQRIENKNILILTKHLK